MTITLSAVFGPPTPLTFALHRLILPLVESAFGSAKFAHVNQLDVMRATWEEAAADGGANLVIVAEAPESRLSDLFIRAGVKSIVCLEPMQATTAHLRHLQGLEFYTAVRQATFYMIMSHDLACSPTSLLINHKWLGRPLDGVIAEVAAFVGIVADAAMCRALADQLIRAPEGRATLLDLILRDYPDSAPHFGLHAGLSGDERGATRHAATGYDILQSGERITEMEWDPALFINAVDHIAALPRAVPLAGPARHFIFGPYLHLPLGNWQATVEFEITDNNSANELLIDFVALYGGQMVAGTETQFSPPTRGRFRMKLQLEVAQPEAPLEVRMRLVRGAIEGAFTLERVTVERVETGPASQ